MHRRRDGVIELEQRFGAFQRDGVEQAWIAFELPPSLRSQRAKKMPGVYAAKPAFDEA